MPNASNSKRICSPNTFPVSTTTRISACNRADTLEIRRSADATDIVDSVTITPLANGLALARFPEGSGPFLQALATPGDALPADADQRLVINEFLLRKRGCGARPGRRRNPPWWNFSTLALWRSIRPTLL